MLSFSLIFVLSIAGVSLFCLNRPEQQAKFVFFKKTKSTYRFLSAALVHKDLLHLFANIFTLYLFADSVEHELAITWGSWGKWFFSLIFLGAIFLGNFFWQYNRFSEENSFGSTAGVAAVLASHFLYFPLNSICIFILCLPGFVGAILFMGYVYYEKKRIKANFLVQQWVIGTLWGLLVAFLLKPSSLWNFFKILVGN